jgi:hypothetical protein
MQVQGPGTLTFQMQVGAEDWQTVATIKVKKAPAGAILN